MRLNTFLNQKEKPIRPAKINMRNIMAVLQAFLRKKRRKIGGWDLENHIYEQIIWRRTQVIQNSPICWHSGTCKICGCDILGKTMEDRGCSILEHADLLLKRNPCYPAMMNKNEWKEYKKLKNIKLFD